MKPIIGCNNNSTMCIMETGIERQIWLKLGQNVQWFVSLVTLKLWNFWHIYLSKFLTITPHLYHLPPLQTSKLLNFMRIYHKISLCISPSMLNFQTTVISFISLHYQSDKHSSFFSVYSFFSSFYIRLYCSLWCCQTDTIFILPFNQKTFPNNISRNTT